MARIYLHIPFCRKACVYCDFHFVTSLKNKREMVAAICKEAELRSNFFDPDDRIVESVYLGGGTPSVLDTEDLSHIFSALVANWMISPDAEITLEANPDDLTTQYIETLQRVGINRLSVGIQSFADDDLQWMNRSHNAHQALACIEKARSMGLVNISVDLILGLPNRSTDDWRRNIGQALELDIPHLSVYALTVEQKTVLHHWVQKGISTPATDTEYERQYLLTHELLCGSGYDHYEISNYALPGSYAQHNSAYWNGEPYLGLGPSAHSFTGITRSWNHRNNAKYLETLGNDEIPQENMELLSETDQLNEYLLTHLRSNKGIDLEEIQRNFHVDLKAKYGDLLDQWVKEAYLYSEKGRFKCSPKGWLVSDDLISRLFLSS